MNYLYLPSHSPLFFYNFHQSFTTFFYFFSSFLPFFLVRLDGYSINCDNHLAPFKISIHRNVRNFDLQFCDVTVFTFFTLGSK